MKCSRRGTSRVLWVIRAYVSSLAAGSQLTELSAWVRILPAVGSSFQQAVDRCSCHEVHQILGIFFFLRPVRGSGEIPSLMPAGSAVAKRAEPQSLQIELRCCAIECRGLFQLCSARRNLCFNFNHEPLIFNSGTRSLQLSTSSAGQGRMRALCSRGLPPPRTCWAEEEWPGRRRRAPLCCSEAILATCSLQRAPGVLSHRFPASELSWERPGQIRAPSLHVWSPGVTAGPPGS